MTDSSRHSGQSTAEQRPGRPRDPAVDTAILTAAREVFVARGVEATSIEAVAQRAGVTRLTIYRRYRDKQELLLHMLTTSRDEPIPDLEAEQLTLDALTELLTRVLAGPQKQQLLLRVAGAAADHPELIRAFWQRFVQPRREELAALLVRMQQAGRLDRRADPDTVLDIAAGAIIYHLLLRPDERCQDALQARARAALQQAGLHEAQPK